MDVFPSFLLPFFPRLFPHLHFAVGIAIQTRAIKKVFLRVNMETLSLSPHVSLFKQENFWMNMKKIISSSHATISKGKFGKQKSIVRQASIEINSKGKTEKEKQEKNC